MEVVGNRFPSVFVGTTLDVELLASLFLVVPQVDSGKIYISAPGPTPAADAVAKEGGVANTSEAFEFLSATFGATLPGGHVAVVPSLPEDACSPLAPLAIAAAAEGRESGAGSSDEGGVLGGGASTDHPPSTAVLVKRGGCSFGVKAKNVQVWAWCRHGLFLVTRIA